MLVIILALAGIFFSVIAIRTAIKVMRLQSDPGFAKAALIRILWCAVPATLLALQLSTIDSRVYTALIAYVAATSSLVHYQLIKRRIDFMYKFGRYSATLASLCLSVSLIIYLDFRLSSFFALYAVISSVGFIMSYKTAEPVYKIDEQSLT
ncbi:hypothetical protein CVU83_00010 [Candidatus Falkowbacteria bacterium HGW-Falkowbacteria-2]|uniref:Uncharacterized protein n=1 Tax=Candidatus Falkowbacteria bacterium HGW-Falkowbacteria-2 TaxID=2013769 RepID=A0A2N2E3V5_9BACT|nr:MAG: hypothetical protein CVU83_00010 [Candidatus Falkowbacteria bacterium HGW-Falkowbacteria-2]